MEMTPFIDLFKLLAILALVVFLLIRRWNLGLTFGLASVLLGLLFGLPPLRVGAEILQAVAAPLTLRLAGIVVLILFLGEILRETAQLDGMVLALERLVPDARVVFAVVPAFIGLLPMIGGAMFSAPMAGHIGDRLGAGRDRKTFVNYWFRHIWEYIWPLYPSFLLGAALLDLSPRQTTALMWPLALASVVGGVLFGLMGLERGEPAADGEGKLAALRDLARHIWPIVLVLVVSMGFGVNLLLSLLGTILLLLLVSRIGGRAVLDILRHRVRWNTVVVILGAMAFKRVLEETGAVVSVSQALTAMNVAPVLAVFVIPFIAGLLSGVGAAAFGIGFPIVLPLLGSSHTHMGMAAWAWAGGFLGTMLSPLHLCLALTRAYFDAEWGRVYRRIVPATLLVLLTAALLLILLPPNL